MNLLHDVEKLVRTFNRNRQRARTERLLASLPDATRKDIGWPDSGATRIRTFSDGTH